MHQLPVLTPGVPVLDDALRGQIQHPAQRIVVGKGRLVFRDLPELAVQTFDDVRRIYDPTNLHWIFKECAEDIPVFFPALHARGILPAPFFEKAARLLSASSSVTAM